MRKYGSTEDDLWKCRMHFLQKPELNCISSHSNWSIFPKSLASDFSNLLYEKNQTSLHIYVTSTLQHIFENNSEHNNRVNQNNFDQTCCRNSLIFANSHIAKYSIFQKPDLLLPLTFLNLNSARHNFDKYKNDQKIMMKFVFTSVGDILIMFRITVFIPLYKKSKTEVRKGVYHSQLMFAFLHW